MTHTLIAFISISALFALFLAIKDIVKWKICAICLGVSATWAIMLALYWLDIFKDPLVLGVLMGQSILGVYYLLEKKVSEELHVFRLPFFLTATFIALLLLKAQMDIYVVIFLAGIWAIFGLVYAGRKKDGTGIFFKKIIACCRDW